MPTETKTESHLLDLERQYWQAMKDNNIEGALKLTDDPCIVSGKQGIRRVSMSEFRKMMKADTAMKVQDFTFKDTEVRMLGRNTAVVAYTVREEMTVDGKPQTFEAADASTWVKRDDVWKCAMHSEAILGN